jgi:hypothetical protein
MKYKVILYNDGSTSSADEFGNFSFYTKASALTCVTSWREYDSDRNGGYLFDGSTWVEYPPIP